MTETENEVCRMVIGRDRSVTFGFHEFKGRVYVDITPIIPDKVTGQPTPRRGVTVPLDGVDEFIDSLRITQSKAADV